MRRLVLATGVLASLVLAMSTGAIAARSGAHLTLKGSAHESRGKLQGGFTVENTGAARAAALTAKVKLVGSGKRPARLTVQHAAIPALAPGAKQRVKIKATVPGKADSGTWSIVACAGSCVKIGKLAADSGGGQNPKKATAPNAPTPPAPSTPAPPTPTPVCTPSTGPLSYGSEEPFRHVGECGVEYFGVVPKSYNPSTPMPLLVWAHGCGGEAEGDAGTVGSSTAEAGHGWLTLSLGGRDGGCWVPSIDEAKVMAAVEDFEAHFDVDRHRIFLGGYSSGGDLAYRTGFRHSSTFAGLLIENSSPFRGTESTEAESLGAATTKFHIAHLAHSEDTEYPIATVHAEIEAVENAGFPVTFIQKPGGHYDSHTYPDLQEELLPLIETSGWTSP